MAYKSYYEVEAFSKTGGWVSGTPVNSDISLSSGGPYKLLGYRYEVISTAGVTGTDLAFYYHDGTNGWLVLDGSGSEIVDLVAAITGSSTVRKEVRLRGNNDSQVGFVLGGTYRTSFTFSGVFNENESANVTLLLERQVI